MYLIKFNLIKYKLNFNFMRVTDTRNIDSMIPTSNLLINEYYLLLVGNKYLLTTCHEFYLLMSTNINIFVISKEQIKQFLTSKKKGHNYYNEAFVFFYLK